MSKKKFHVNVRKFVLAKKACCGECDKCYIEQLWRDTEDYGNCHCTRTKNAFSVALKGKDRDMEEHSLPEKDECIVAVLKTGQHVCVKLFYDHENKPYMYYDDFDNWYSISDVTFLDFVLPEYVDIKVEDNGGGAMTKAKIWICPKCNCKNFSPIRYGVVCVFCGYDSTKEAKKDGIAKTD